MGTTQRGRAPARPGLHIARRPQRRITGCQTGPGAPPLAGVRRVLVGACAAFVPLQLVLLVVGEPHGTTDAIGVIGTLAQWAVLATALYPGSRYRAATGKGGRLRPRAAAG